jgi:hypothetical protein
MERGDWETFFACLDRTELLVIARNSVGLLAAVTHEAASPVGALFARHAFPLDALRARGRDILDSAQRMRSMAPPASVRETSLRHQRLVKSYRETLDAGLKAVSDLAAFTAGLERAVRSGGGGSVSTRLLVGETLEEVVVDDQKARGTRRLSGGGSEPIAFVRKKGEWYIRLPKPRV